MTFDFKLIVFNIEKPQNLGLLMRNAYAFGCQELLIVGRKRFKVTGAGHTQNLTSSRHFFNMKEAAAYCKQEGYEIWGVEIGGEWTHETAYDRNVALVMGNEGRGLSDAQSFCERIISIPQWGGVPSLNVAAAGAIAMYEFQKNQGRPPAAVEGQKFYDNHFLPYARRVSEPSKPSE